MPASLKFLPIDFIAGGMIMAVANLPVDQRVIDIDSRRFASIEKALVELITNGDDSYSRLESVHTPIDPVIRI